MFPFFCQSCYQNEYIHEGNELCFPVYYCLVGRGARAVQPCVWDTFWGESGFPFQIYNEQFDLFSYVLEYSTLYCIRYSQYSKYGQSVQSVRGCKFQESLFCCVCCNYCKYFVFVYVFGNHFICCYFTVISINVTGLKPTASVKELYHFMDDEPDKLRKHFINTGSTLRAAGTPGAAQHAPPPVATEQKWLDWLRGVTLQRRTT